jgi:predicted small metal-binding protein
MRKLSCRSLGRDCEWEFIGDDDEEVMKKAIEHDLKMHGHRLEPEEQQRMRGKIHDS